MKRQKKAIALAPFTLLNGARKEIGDPFKLLGNTNLQM